jgi:hypothetical protein
MARGEQEAKFFALLPDVLTRVREYPGAEEMARVWGEILCSHEDGSWAGAPARAKKEKLLVVAKGIVRGEILALMERQGLISRQLADEFTDAVSEYDHSLDAESM